MSVVITTAGVMGPFKTIEVLADRLLCNGNEELPFTVIGSYTLSEDDSLAPVPPPVIPTIAEYTNAVQALLDTTAQSKGYDSIISCCSYVGAPNAFQAEGQAAIGWRGSVWETCYSIMVQAQAGTIPAPTIDELLTMLPVMVWPTTDRN